MGLALESVLRCSTLPLAPPTPSTCSMQQGLPLWHCTMVYSMPSNGQQPRDHAGHGQATTEQTYPRSSAGPVALLAPKAPYHAAV